MQENRRIQGHLFGAFSVLVWGTTFVSTKVLLRAFTPLEIMVARFTLGFLALLLVGKGLVRQLGHMGYHTIPLTCRIFGYGLLFLLVPAVIEGFPSGLSVWTQPVHLANLLFLGLCASATCFVTWNRAVFLLGPVKTSVYIYATPVITIVSSALILHETMTPIMWLGTVLALGGLILSEHREKEKTTA